MQDEIFRGFLESMERLARQLVAESGILSLVPAPGAGRPPDTWLGLLRGVEHLERDASGGVRRSSEPIPFQVHFPGDYLRSVDPSLQLRVVRVGAGEAGGTCWHPNIRDGCVCLGARLAPGSTLRALVTQLHLICSGQVFSTLDPLDPEAARYFVDHLEEVRAMALRAPPLWRAPLARSARVVEIHPSR
jgi:hypothetical protein